MQLIRLRGKGQLTLPDDVRREAHLAEGDYLAVIVRDGAIVLEPRPRWMRPRPGSGRTSGSGASARPRTS